MNKLGLDHIRLTWLNSRKLLGIQDPLTQLQIDIIMLIIKGILQGLEAGEEGVEVTDQRPTGDGANPGIGKGPHQFGDGAGLELGISVQADDDPVADLLEALDQGPGLAQIRLAHQADAVVLPR